MSIRPPAWNFVSVAHLQSICIYLYKVPSFFTHMLHPLLPTVFFYLLVVLFFSLWYAVVASSYLFPSFRFFTPSYHSRSLRVSVPLLRPISPPLHYDHSLYTLLRYLVQWLRSTLPLIPCKICPSDSLIVISYLGLISS